MNFTNYITEASKQKPHKGLYGQVISNYFTLKNIKLTENIQVDNSVITSIWFDKEKNRLDIDFRLFYKNYTLAEVELEFFSPSQFQLIANTEKTSNIQDVIKVVDDEFDTIFKFELTTNTIIVQAKNEQIDFQLKSHFKELNIDIDYLNSISFIDILAKRPKHSNLFNTLCGIVTDKQLTSIANADYGWKAEECFIDLKQMQQTQILPKEISFNLLEVLSLTRYGGNIKNNEEHQTLLFVCTIILLGKYGNQYDMLDNTEQIIASMFTSANKLGSFFIEQSQSFFLEILSKNTSPYEIQMFTYLIVGFDLLLKKEVNFKNSFHCLQKTSILNDLNFKTETVNTAEKIEKASLLMLDNLSFIKDKLLQKNAKQFFTAIILLCKERYDINAINALFDRIFTKEEQVDYLKLLPEVLNIQFRDRYNYFANKGLTSKQVQIITDSLFNAKMFIEGSDYELELNKNVFFDAWVEIKENQKSKKK